MHPWRVWWGFAGSSSRLSTRTRVRPDRTSALIYMKTCTWACVAFWHTRGREILEKDFQKLHVFVTLGRWACAVKSCKMSRFACPCCPSFCAFLTWLFFFRPGKDQHGPRTDKRLIFFWLGSGLWELLSSASQRENYWNYYSDKNISRKKLTKFASIYLIWQAAHTCSKRSELLVNNGTMNGKIYKT